MSRDSFRARASIALPGGRTAEIFRLDALRKAMVGDVDTLPALASLAAELDTAITDAVAGLRSAGYSWGEIAARLGVTRQAAHQRWAPALTAPTDARSPDPAGSSPERGAA